MKTYLPSFALGLLAACLAHSAPAAAAVAVAVFYSFDTSPDGTGDFTAGYSAINGFNSASSVTRTGTTQANVHAGGEATFTDFAGTEWKGSGNSAMPGHSLTWNQNSTGNSFSVTLDTTGLESLAVRLGIRSAGSGAPAAFTSFTYAIGSGKPVGIDTVALSFPTGGNFNEWSADLSAIVALSNQNSV
ncbi:MAG: hypothetical protein LBK99_24110, partial [Opitutaceae bacterium]|nr:hypothetical protein [Opitutaceae bacterium]